MKLKSIELSGFKSFPDKTRIAFDRGVTAIIGPNGSGKSNISDAVRWVLGEMSPKSLRGSKMEDVIFNGTSGRNAANCASVSLILDTSAEYAAAMQEMSPAAEEAEEPAEGMPKVPRPQRIGDTDEVVVTRKFYRSGESEYYINKRQVRLKDVYEMFYDTGIGREGYSVIGQGRIAEVLSQKGDERRSIFEEASGISKFRYKKLEAERKLRDTEQTAPQRGRKRKEIPCSQRRKDRAGNNAMAEQDRRAEDRARKDRELAHMRQAGAGRGGFRAFVRRVRA